MLLFLSNRQEILADILSLQLFPPESDPLMRRLIVVPSDKAKHFLMRRLVHSLPALAGVEILSLKAALHRLAEDCRIPTRLEMSLHIEYMLKMQGKEFDCEGGEEFVESLMRQGIYGEESGEEELFRSLREGGWRFPCEGLAENRSVHFSVHIWGFSFLPKPHLHFFNKYGCRLYLFSPCALFWEDLCSGKQKAFLHQKLGEKKSQELDHYLQGQNVLLANLGRMGRQFLKLLGEEEYETEEHYHPSEGKSVLEEVQDDLLHLHMQRRDGREDLSLEVHRAASKLREVEILLENLQRLFPVEPFEPEEVVVLAPDIDDYVPYIHQVFGEADIPYAIFDSSLAAEMPFARGFVHLLSLSEERFTVDAYPHQLRIVQIDLWRRRNYAMK